MNIPIKPIIRERFKNADYSSSPRIDHEGSVLVKKGPRIKRRPLAPAKPPMRLG